MFSFQSQPCTLLTREEGEIDNYDHALRSSRYHAHRGLNLDS